jgi:hypothetical protein
MGFFAMGIVKRKRSTRRNCPRAATWSHVTRPGIEPWPLRWNAGNYQPGTICTSTASTNTYSMDSMVRTQIRLFISQLRVIILKSNFRLI